MNEILNIEEKKEILNTLYYDNYIKNLEVKDNNYYQKLMKRYRLFKTNDNNIIVFEEEKPSIDNTLWFDDELPIPELTEELFINYNMHNLHTIKEDGGLKTFLYNPYYKCENPFNCFRCSQNGYSYAVNDKTFIRHLTDAEEEFILKLDDEIKEKYIKRLKSYYKKYKNKIYCMGYWVNR